MKPDVDMPLKEPLRKFEDTFSAETVVLEKFFKKSAALKEQEKVG